MLRSRWSVGLLVLVLCAGLVAGCGGGGGGGSKTQTESKTQYKKDAKAILDEAKTSLQSLQTRVQGKSGNAALAELDKTRQEVVSAANRLDQLTPPPDVKAQHDNFVNALRTFGQDFQPVEAAGKAKDKAAAQKALQKLQADAQQLQTASSALEAKLK